MKMGSNCCLEADLGVDFVESADVKDAFAIISKEESHRGIVSSSSSGFVSKPQDSGFMSKTNNWTNNRNKKVDNKKYGNTVNTGNNIGPNPNFLFKNYGKVGHTIDKCFDLIGYPLGYNKNFGPKQNGFKSFDANTASTSNANGTRLSFTNEHMMKLMNLINEVPYGNMQANMAGRASFFYSIVFFNINFKVFFNSNSVMESRSETWTRFMDLLQKVPHHGIDHWLPIQIFYDHVSFPLKYEIDRAGDQKHHDKNDDKSWEIIENLALYDHEGWNDLKDSIKLVKAIIVSPNPHTIFKLGQPSVLRCHEVRYQSF
nr:ribonuclease H-like domain-containing protein [Tanacetum cinerariifolium]GEZ45998.1 ribonuclease H-like domain-containing protein [Tanacetum cinerariifolium]